MKKTIIAWTALCSVTFACTNENRQEFITNGDKQNLIEIGNDNSWEKEKAYLAGKEAYIVTQDLVSGNDFLIEAELSIDSVGFSNASFLLFDSYFNFDGKMKEQEKPVVVFSGSLAKETCLVGKTADLLEAGAVFNFKVSGSADSVRFFLNEDQVFVCESALGKNGRIGFRAGNKGMKLYNFSVIGQTEKGEMVNHLFKSGTEGYHTFRIPAIEVSNKGTVLAFADARVEAAHDAGDINIVLKRSEDGGKTWGNSILVFDETQNTAGNVTPVIDRETGTIFVFSTWNLGDDYEWQIINGSSKDTRRVFVTQSDDDGLTWTQAKEITAQVKQPDWTWYATGPCHGIQIQQGSHKGRLVIPCDHIEQDSKKYYSHIIYSDDHGQTWKLGGRTPTDMVNECTVAELEDGKLMLNMRNYDPAKRTRKVSVSEDGGISWSELRADDALIEPICQAGMHRHSFKADGVSRLLFLNPANTKSRSNMTLRISYDDGQTWEKSSVLYPGPSAYSDVVKLPNGNIGCLYEAGYIHPYEGIVFCEIPLNEIEQ